MTVSREGVAALRRTTFSYGPHHAQRADLWCPGEPRRDGAVVVLLHGGYWRTVFTKRLMNGLARAITERGFFAYNVEYRRVGLFGTGGWPATFCDVADAIDHLATLDVPGRVPGLELGLEGVVTCGHSAGGTLALWAAGRSRLPEDAPGSTPSVRVRGAVSLAGVTDLVASANTPRGAGPISALMGGSPEAVPERYRGCSPAALLPLGVPQVLIHGLADTTVSPEVSESYQRAAVEAGDDAIFVPLAGLGHRDLIDARGPGFEAVVVGIERVCR